MPLAAAAPHARPARDSRADVIRGLAIAAVVYIHADGMVDFGRGPAVPTAAARWCVPTFVTLAAFFAVGTGRAAARGYGADVRRRLGRLLVPLVAWTVVYIVVRRAWRADRSPAALAGYFNGFGWAGQYYFLILLQVAAIGPVLARCRVRLGWVIAAFAVLIVWTTGPVGLAWPGDDRVVLFWVPYLLLGGWLARRWSGRLGRPMPVPAGLAVVVGCTAALAWAPPLGRAASAVAFMPYQDPLLVGLMPAIFLGLCAAASGLPRPVAGPLAVAGRYSLGIYCMNPLLDGQAARRLLAPVHLPASLWTATLCPAAEVVGIVALLVLASVALDRCGLSRLVR